MILFSAFSLVVSLNWLQHIWHRYHLTASPECSYASWASSPKYCTNEGLSLSLSLCGHFPLLSDFSLISFTSLQINHRSIQDLHIFGDPSHIPIVIVERVINAPRRTISANSYFSHFDFKDSARLVSGSSFETTKKQSGAGPQQNGCILKVVVFVHGFQVCC